MKKIGKDVIQNLYHEAEISVRKRSHYLLHNSHSEKVQRLLIGLIKGSYVEPHYHELPHQWEMFVVLRGEVRVTLYTNNGDVNDVFLVNSNNENNIIELSPNEVHSLECLSDKALLLEVKEGPFIHEFAKSFPRW